MNARCSFHHSTRTPRTVRVQTRAAQDVEVAGDAVYQRRDYGVAVAVAVAVVLADEAEQGGPPAGPRVGGRWPDPADCTLMWPTR